MASAFMAIPWRAKEQPRQSISPDETFIPDPEEPDLRDLNAALEALTDLFPDIQPEVFREMLSSFDEESRLQVITESLLKHGAKWVRGRYRMPQEQPQHREMEHTYKYKTGRKKEDSRGAPLALEDRFRTGTYKNAVKVALYQEFKGLPHSTIRAVLAEYNYSYTQSRPTLLALVSKSWRYSITAFLMRRKPPSPDNHPLVTWRAPDHKTGDPPIPLVAPTKSAELDKELFETLILPVLNKQKADQINKDRELAHELNEAQAEEVGELYDCECCFTPNTMEQISTCDDDSHYICFRCIRHSINAALYGQGWTRNIDSERCTLRCIAPVTNGLTECHGCISPEFIKRALSEDKDGEDSWRRLEERAASETLLKSQLPLIKCPFCPYAEIDDAQLPDTRLAWRLKNRPVIALSAFSMLHILYLEVLRMIFRFLVLIIFLLLTVNYLLPGPIPVFAVLDDAMTRLTRKRRGMKFTCRSPFCRRSSCISCNAEWHDIHICHESARTALRVAVERAMADAIKRTCPACNLSFVKSSGCNKLTCVCGYQMCYVCRAEIGKESYAHFCQHFRQDPGKACTECERCDLYRTEDEDVVIRRAAEKAEREWRAKEGLSVDATGEVNEKGKGASRLGARANDVSLDMGGYRIWNRQTWEGWLDWVLDSVIA
ncbi:hypothetical protein AOQ84DRAFT_397472 [Glonium stellatum]|uniref:RING-type domain-containing protein n=1 Tax=Glonium stellatum TaxID=574774 RepID=A0A8E2F353_9PEZI|nr:hypothetical protein AOQ84DRAFT_397472 [Glonium stellatum]